jgi:RNA polymerase sigma-70 factor (ECF subfamily)
LTTDQYELCFRTYYKPLVIYAYKIVRRQDVAEDMVQQVFLNVWERIEEMDIEKGITAYLYQGTRNRCLNHLRSAYQSTTTLIDQPVGEHLITSDKHLEAKELFQQIQAAILELPEKCREVFLLSREQGLTYKEIASTLNLSIKTVENQMGKALKHLYTRIGTNLDIIFILFFLNA